MPIVIDPGFAWPPEVDPVVSPDGRLTAIVDPAHAGVLLRADFDDSVPDTPAVPEKVLRRNLISNPSFETNSNDVRRTQGAATIERVANAEYSTSGGASLWATGPANPTSRTDICLQDTPISVEPGSWVGFSVDVRPGLTLGTKVRMILWAHTDGASGLFDYKPTSDDLPTYAFKRISWVQKLPDGANGVEPWLSIQGSTLQSSPPPNWRVIIDSVNIVSAPTKAEAQAALDSGYFDGSTAPSGTKRYRWTGTPHASVSEEYTPATPFVPGHGSTTAKVRFERQDGSVVRSGNPAWAPGGYAHAYDHEATLGGGTLWRAVPIRFDGTEGEPSEYVGAVIPALSDGWAWLKPVADPDKAMLLKAEPPDLSYDGRVDTTSIAGAPRPAATWDVLEGFTTQLRSLVREKDVEEQLMALLDEGPVLAQFPACAGLPDFYFIRGKLDLEHVHWDGWPWRRYQWDVIQIDRPDTTDSPLRIPGLSYDTVERDWTTYDQLKSTVVSYNKLLEP